MKRIFYLFFILVFFGCEDKIENRNNLFSIFALISISINSKPTETCFGFNNANCTANILEYKTNLKSIKILLNNKEIIESQITDQTQIYLQCGGGYFIPFQKNNEISSLTVYKLKDNYCGLKLFKTNNSVESYEMSFNGDLNTLTELNVGEYKFVPVR